MSENESSKMASLGAREESSINNEGVRDSRVEKMAASLASATESIWTATGPEFAMVKGAGVTTDRSGSGE
jgi:hypothetical protein